jgi:hypothetical protein
MGRPAWLAAGVVLGVGGTLWAEKRVRRAVRQVADHLTPSHMVGDAAASARAVGARVREAVASAREERARREAELRRELDEAPPLRVVGQDAARRRARAAPGRARASR